MNRPRESYVPCAPTHNRGGSIYRQPGRPRPPLSDNQPVTGLGLTLVRAWKALKKGRRHD